MAKATLDIPRAAPPPTAVPPAPAPTTEPLVSRSWNEAAETYLMAAGWEKVGSNERGYCIWADPKGVKDQKTTGIATIELPAAGGGKEIVKQCVTPPVPWNYGTEEAVCIQRERDRSGESPEQTIRRKRAELEHLEELASRPASGASR